MATHVTAIREVLDWNEGGRATCGKKAESWKGGRRHYEVTDR